LKSSLISGRTFAISNWFISKRFPFKKREEGDCYIPGFSKVTVNVVRGGAPGGTCPCGHNHPELI
jgi:hypothetical protein